MKRINPVTLWLSVALLIWFSALVLAVAALVQTPARIRFMERGRDTIMRLKAMQTQKQEMEENLKLHLKLKEKNAVSLQSTLQSLGLSQQATVRRKKTENLIDPWVRRTVEVIFTDVPFDSVGKFLYTIETQQPPWRIQEVIFDAADQNGTGGRVSLVLQTVDAKQ